MARIQYGKYQIEHDGVCWMMCKGWRKRKKSDRMYPIQPGWYGDLHQVAQALVDAEMVDAVELGTDLAEVVRQVAIKLVKLEPEIIHEDVER